MPYVTLSLVPHAPPWWVTLHRDLRQRRHRQDYFVIRPGSPASFLTHRLVLSKMKTAGAMSHFFLKVSWLMGTLFGRISGNDLLRDLGGSMPYRELFHSQADL